MAGRVLYSSSFARTVRKCVAIILIVAAFLCGFLVHFNQTYAHSNQICRNCNPNMCDDAEILIRQHHANGRLLILTHITQRFIDYRQWLLGYDHDSDPDTPPEGFFQGNLLPAMMRMTEQLSAVGMHQMLAVGTMMDAKIQLETQRDIQQLQVEALKDYHPSEDYCAFGTNARSLSASEHEATNKKLTLNKISLTRHLASMNSAGAASGETDRRSRWDVFVNQNCMVFNNNWSHNNPTISGLEPLCGSSANSERANRDIHYSRFVDQVRTIDGVDFTNAVASPSETDIIALARNLYGHEALKRNVGMLTLDTTQSDYADLRSVAAKRTVAENSFNTIVSMKMPGTANGAANTREFMASIMNDLGIEDIDDIVDVIGENPSYYSQLEMLGKRIYQDQTFYANLYDKPENVARTVVAMRAIELMLDREMYESQLRKEMLISVLLASKLQENYEKVESDLEALSAED